MEESGSKTGKGEKPRRTAFMIELPLWENGAQRY